MARIFYDMDGTIADFNQGNMANAVASMFNKGYFRTLPVIEQAQSTIARLVELGHEIHILTACVDSPYCEAEKREWLAEHFPMINPANWHFCPIGVSKAQWVKATTNDVLIDDYKANLIDWAKYGGMAIKKRTTRKISKYPMPCIYNHNQVFRYLEMME